MAKPNPFMQKALDKAKAEQRTKRDNPFLKPPKGKEGIKPQGPKRISEEEWEEKRALAHLMIRQKGLKVGDRVRVTWNYDRAYGPGTASHEGVIAELDDWIKCRPFSTSNGVLHLPLTAVAAIERIEKIEKPAPKPNPFMKA